ncbi:MAG: hypothetical protein J5365_03500 [Erysipelotrichaceae bacterium]|nr:hypothetical protein [Erysipelotrichaceae bacterium]
MSKNKDKFEIELLSRNYINSKRIIKETEEDIIHCSYERLKAYRRIVSHIENVAECLGEKERLIIQKEVIEGKSGKWYLEYFSAPSYYRHRRKAYSEFLRCL